MSIGSLYSASLLDASTKTQPVEPVIYRPELRRGDKSFQYLRTPKFDTDWLYRELFVASKQIDSHQLNNKSILKQSQHLLPHLMRTITFCFSLKKNLWNK